MARTTTKVFVYGTLLRGQSNHILLESATYLGRTKTSAGYSMFAGNHYPAVIHEGFAEIHGEVYEVTAEQLTRLDALEGYPDYYGRESVELANGMTALLYLMSPERMQGLVANASWSRVEGGDWVAWKRRNLLGK